MEYPKVTATNYSDGHVGVNVHTIIVLILILKRQIYGGEYLPRLLILGVVYFPMVVTSSCLRLEYSRGTRT